MATDRTKLVEQHTNRAAKHPYKKQRCKTCDNIHIQMKTYTCKSETCSVSNQRQPNSLRDGNTLLSDFLHQWKTQSLNPTLWKRMALETRTPNDTHPRSKRTARKRAATIHPGMAGCQSPKMRQNSKNTHPCSAQAPPPTKHVA